MTTPRASKKQQELLQFIDEFIQGHGYGPSYREVMRALDYKSVSTVAAHVNQLIVKGYLEKKDNSARSLVVVKLHADGLSKSTQPSLQALLTEKIEALRKADDTDAVDILEKALDVITRDRKV